MLSPDSTPPIKFLLVDDLAPNRLALVGLLRREGLELLEASSGAEALELLLIHDVALALLDVQMPGMDGFELAELMRGTERTRRIPIIFLTAGAVDFQRRFRGYNIGAVDFIFKPIEPHILQSKADVFFELARQRSELAAAQKKLSEHAANLERTVDERTAVLRETVHELESFSYSIVHDMRAPLRSMQGFSTMLLEEHAAQLDDTGKSYLQRIVRSASRMDALIRDVLNYTKIVRGNAPLEAVDLDRLIRDIIEDFPKEQTRDAEIRVEGTLPRVLGHEGFLTQCISNLIGNAIKFVGPGVVPRILIWAEKINQPKASSVAPLEPVIRLWIEDNGIGIAPTFRDRIFRMFERIHPAEEFDGTGIGLTIVRKAVERMGGGVGVESEPGKGSEFWLDLKMPPE